MSDEETRLIATPFGSFQSYPTSPKPDVFKLEPSSGYYFDKTTGFYCDKEKTGYFYDPINKAWKFWSDTYRTYIPIEGEDKEEKKRLIWEERQAKDRAVAEKPGLQPISPVIKRSLDEEEPQPTSSKQRKHEHFPQTEDLPTNSMPTNVKITNLPAYMTKETLRKSIELENFMPIDLKINRIITPNGDVDTTAVVTFSSYEEAKSWVEMNENIIIFSGDVIGNLVLEPKIQQGSTVMEAQKSPAKSESVSSPRLSSFHHIPNTGAMKERQGRKSTPELLIPVSPPMEQSLKCCHQNLSGNSNWPNCNKIFQAHNDTNINLNLISEVKPNQNVPIPIQESTITQSGDTQADTPLSPNSYIGGTVITVQLPEKAIPTTTPIQWTCVKCSTSNAISRSKCFKCGTSKIQSDELEAKGNHLIGTLPCDTLILQNLPGKLSLTIDEFFQNFPQFTRKIYISKSKLYCLMQVKSENHADLVLKIFEKHKKENKIISKEVSMNYAKKKLNDILEENEEEFTLVSSNISTYKNSDKGETSTETNSNTVKKRSMYF